MKKQPRTNRAVHTGYLFGMLSEALGMDAVSMYASSRENAPHAQAILSGAKQAMADMKKHNEEKRTTMK